MLSQQPGHASNHVVADKMLPHDVRGKLAVTFLTYGFKHGAPRDADLLFDVRFLPNPHWEPDLRPLTGYDQRVVDYVRRQGTLDAFYERLIPLIDFLIPQYRAALTAAVITVALELVVLAWIRSRFFQTGFLRSVASVSLGGVIIATVSAALGAAS